jgi:hypothetical protein
MTGQLHTAPITQREGNVRLGGGLVGGQEASDPEPTRQGILTAVSEPIGIRLADGLHICQLVTIT